MSVEAPLDDVFADFDWAGAGLDEPARWPHGVRAGMLFCLAWPRVGFAVLGDKPFVVSNAAATRRFHIGALTPLDEATDRLGPELAELIGHGMRGKVGRSAAGRARYLVAPLMPTPNGATGVLVLSAGSAAVAQDQAQHLRALLARLRSIVVESAETAQSIEDYVAHLDGRISAAGRAHTSAVLSGEIANDFETILRDELGLAARGEEDYKVEGPEIIVPLHAVDAMVLALHELATNAVKFGAFSQPNAFLTVTWRIEPRPPGDWLVIDWTESGVTLETEPRREGFGTMLIRQRLPAELKGETELSFRPGGVRARLAFPLRPASDAAL